MTDKKNGKISFIKPVFLHDFTGREVSVDGSARETPENGFFDPRVKYQNKYGEEVSPLETVFPIGLYDPEIDFFQPIATGIFISSDGLICTAKHVFDLDDRFFATMPHISRNSFPAIIQYFPNHTSIVRKIVSTSHHENYDLSVAICDPLHSKKDDIRFKNSMHAMNADILEIGSNVHQFSFPEPLNYERDLELETVLIPQCTTGVIIDWLPEGMGRLFPSPVYVIAGHVGAGSSGGPIIDKYGRAFAVTSRGCGAENYYYAIPLKCIADITVKSLVLATPPIVAFPTIRQMVQRKMISFVDVVDVDKPQI